MMRILEGSFVPKVPFLKVIAVIAIYTGGLCFRVLNRSNRLKKR